MKPTSQKEYRRVRRLAQNQNGKRKVVVIVRERVVIPSRQFFNSESQAASVNRAGTARKQLRMPMKQRSWDNLHERFEVKRINHQEAYSRDGACTNVAEEYISRLRRAETGIHYHTMAKQLDAQVVTSSGVSGTKVSVRHATFAAA